MRYHRTSDTASRATTIGEIFEMTPHRRSPCPACGRMTAPAWWYPMLDGSGCVCFRCPDYPGSWQEIQERQP